MSPSLILGILLAVSVLLNGWQYREHTVDSVKFGTTQQLADDTRVAAEACSDGVNLLAEDGKKRQGAIILAIDATRGRIEGLQRDALAANQARPDNPADLCGSIERYLKAQIRKEREPAK